MLVSSQRRALLSGGPGPRWIVPRLNPSLFAELERFDREIQVYLVHLEMMAPPTGSGLHFCFPDVSAEDRTVSAVETFNLTLANKLVGDKTGLITNDIDLSGKERIILVSGPNQGGKTTVREPFGSSKENRKQPATASICTIAYFPYRDNASFDSTACGMVHSHGIVAPASPRKNTESATWEHSNKD